MMAGMASIAVLIFGENTEEVDICPSIAAIFGLKIFIAVFVVDENYLAAVEVVVVMERFFA